MDIITTKQFNKYIKKAETAKSLLQTSSTTTKKEITEAFSGSVWSFYFDVDQMILGDVVPGDTVADQLTFAFI